MIEKEAELTIALATRFIEEMQTLAPNFEKAFFRFYAEARMIESCGSYVEAKKAKIVSAFDLDEFFDEMNEKCVELLAEMNQNPALLLLTVDSELEYEIQFEYSDMSKWQISLADGGTGIPTP